MFRCQECLKVSKPHDSPKKLVTKTRQKEYFTEEGKTVRTAKGLPATGWEIVEEILVCEPCSLKERE